MNIEIRPIKQVTPAEYEITVDGKRIGEIDRRVGDDGWRAMLSIQDARLVGTHLLFGYGDTHASAIDDAILNGRFQIAAITEGVAKLDEIVRAERVRQVQYS